MTCASSIHPFCCQDTCCFTCPFPWDIVLCRKDVYFGLSQVRDQNNFPSGSCSHHLSGRKRRDGPAIAPLQKRRKPLCITGFLEKKLPYLFLWQEVEAGGVCASAPCEAQPPLRHALSAHLASPHLKSFHIIYDSERKEKKNQSVGQDSKDRLGTPGGASH